MLVFNCAVGDKDDDVLDREGTPDGVIVFAIVEGEGVGWTVVFDADGCEEGVMVGLALTGRGVGTTVGA